MSDNSNKPAPTNPNPAPVAAQTTKKKPKMSLQPREILDKVLVYARKAQRYSVFIFLLFLALLYGFVLLRIHSLNTAEPSSDAVSSQVKAAAIPHIDPTVVQQLQSLQNNSVSVQALFNQARSNPFQE